MPKQKSQKELDRIATLDYFKSVTSEPMNYTVTAAQLKRLMSENVDYTYSGIRYCLWYIHTQTNIPIQSIAIVSYYYDESKKYYQWKKKMQKQIKEWKFNDNTIVINRIEHSENIFD